MSVLDPKILQIVALSAAGVALLCLILAVLALVRAAKLRKLLTVVRNDEGEHVHVLAALKAQDDRLRAIGGRVGGLEATMTNVRADLGDAIRHVAVMRYDAFPDMGGRLSYSVALLDDAGDGVVVTAIHGRSDTRSYAKGVKAGASDHELSPEELQAVSYALRGRQRTGEPATA
ncbi:MAG: hypothetical protein JWM93_3564 [Frankiales bacterium]|nr:hypothetical protein [Frankiales bacterium]